jgi:cell division protein FtsQ
VPFWTWSILVVLLLTVVAALLTISPVFGARTLRVDGNVHRSDRQVLAVARISRGDNVFWMDRAAAERRLVADPWIAEATVTRSLPSTVRILVVERSPAAVVDVAGVPPLLVADDGTVLGPGTGRVTGGRLPAIDGTGALPDGTRSGVVPAARILGPMRPALRDRIARITVDGTASVVIRLRTGVVIRYGQIAEEVAKAAAIDGVLRWSWANGRSLAEIDVRSPDSPTARPGTPPG